MSAARLDKGQALAHWRGLPDALPMKAIPLPYKATGSTYGHDGIRIEGSRAFIDSVLARLKPLLAYENGKTRLGLNYQAVQPKPGKPANGGDWVCYVKVHERGPEAQHMNAILAARTGRVAA